MSILTFLFLALSCTTLHAFLRPHRAHRARGHYDKDAIIANLNQPKPIPRVNNIHPHLSEDSSETGTATDKMLDSCDERFFSQRLDHFNSGIGPKGVTHFKQRYFVCGENLFHWTPGDPVFFYFGNEAEVTAYMDYTGLMWEQAPEFNALLVFAEHRYYGSSLPYTETEIMKDTDKLQYATTDQALEDYAVLIDYLQLHHFETSQVVEDAGTRSPLIGFGGSYGGMLGAWFRQKYPQFVDGVVAASSPIWGVLGLIPEADAYGFSRMETYDASPAGGVDNNLCVSNIQQGWSDINSLAKTASGRESLASIFNLCSTPKTHEDTVDFLFSTIEESIAYMSMSSYPYPSGYISSAITGNPNAILPAYPMAYACNQHLTKAFDSTEDRLTGIANFNKVFWNADGEDDCLSEKTGESYNNYIWDFLFCRSLVMPSGSKGGKHDMLWDDAWDVQDTLDWCNDEYNVDVDERGPASRKYGGRALHKAMSNVVFSNGDMDPWMPGGVLKDASESLPSIMIEKAGHHLDLMFSNSKDPQSVKDARAQEVQLMKEWIGQANLEWNMGMCDVSNKKEKKMHPFVSAFNMLL